MTRNETPNVKHVIPVSRNLQKLNMYVFLEFYFLFGSVRFWFIFVHGNETPEYQTCFSFQEPQ